jgi:hypothetical protein
MGQSRPCPGSADATRSDIQNVYHYAIMKRRYTQKTLLYVRVWCGVVPFSGGTALSNMHPSSLAAPQRLSCLLALLYVPLLPVLYIRYMDDSMCRVL